MGTADLAASVLRTLAASQECKVVAAVSQPDRPKGRDLKLQPTPVRQAATDLGIPVLQPEKARDPDFLRTLSEMSPQLIVVAAYGQLLPSALLEIPPAGCLNVHTSLLPAYRGAAPIQWAIADGCTQTGVTIMKMDEGLDTGPIVAQKVVPIASVDTGKTLHDRLAESGGTLLVACLADYLEGSLTPAPQPSSGISHARKLRKEDGAIDWNTSAKIIDCRLRAFTPWPGAHCWYAAGGSLRMLKILSASPWESTAAPIADPGTVLNRSEDSLVIQCGSGVLHASMVQPEGGRPMTGAAFATGHPHVNALRGIPVPPLRG